MPCTPSYNRRKQHGEDEGCSKGKGRTWVDILAAERDSPVTGRRRPTAPSSTWIPRDNRTAVVTSRAKDTTATSSRPSFYLVGKCPTSVRNPKLPKTSDVLRRLLSHSENTSVLEAAELTAQAVKAVWQHHFGLQPIMGKKVRIEAESEEVKLIKADHGIAVWVTNLSRSGRAWSKTAGGLTGFLGQLFSGNRMIYC